MDLLTRSNNNDITLGGMYVEICAMHEGRRTSHLIHTFFFNLSLKTPSKDIHKFYEVLCL